MAENEVSILAGTTGTPYGIALLKDGPGTLKLSLDRNVIVENDLDGYATPIFRSGDTNTVLEDNTN